MSLFEARRLPNIGKSATTGDCSKAHGSCAGPELAAADSEDLVPAGMITIIRNNNNDTDTDNDTTTTNNYYYQSLLIIVAMIILLQGNQKSEGARS